MAKDVFVIKIPKLLDNKFRKEVKKQGKQYNLSLEEALKLWLDQNRKGK